MKSKNDLLSKNIEHYHKENVSYKQKIKVL